MCALVTGVQTCVLPIYEINISRGARQSMHPTSAWIGMTWMIGARLGGIGSAFILARFRRWAPVLLIAANHAFAGRTGVVWGQRVSVSLGSGGRRIFKQKKLYRRSKVSKINNISR